MEITVHNKDMVKVGVLSNTLPDAVHFFNDEWMQDGETGSGYFKCKVSKGNPHYQRIKFDQSTKLSFRVDGKDYVYTVVKLKEDQNAIELEAIYFSSELNYEKAPGVKATSSQGIVWYLEKSGITNYSQLKIGRNEVLDRVRKLEYSEDTDSKLARLHDICASFDAELEFEIQLHDDGRLKEFIVNIYREHDTEHQGVGRRRTDLPPLEYKTGLQGISRTVDYSEIFNAVSVTGKDGLNFDSATAEYRNATGQVEFVKHAGDSRYKAPISANLFPAQIKQPGVSNNDVYIAKVVRTDYTTVGQLMAHALKLLRNHAYPKMDFEMDVSSKVVNDPRYLLAIGDTWQVKCEDLRDDDGNRLLLEFRVSRIIRSFCNPEKNKIEFRNYRRLKSEISVDLLSKVDYALSKIAENPMPKRYEQAILPTGATKESVWLNTSNESVSDGERVYEPNTEYRFSGEEWQKVIVQSNNIADNAVTPEKLEVQELSSVAQNMGTLTAGSIKLGNVIPPDTLNGAAVPEHIAGVAVDDKGIFVAGEAVSEGAGFLEVGKVMAAKLSSGSLKFALALIDTDLNLIENSFDQQNLFGQISYTPETQRKTGGLTISSQGLVTISATDDFTIQAANYTDWITTGVPGVYYRIRDRRCTVRFDVTTTANQDFRLGQVPQQYVVQRLMKIVHGWYAINNVQYQRIFQLSDNGNMYLLKTANGHTFAGMVSWDF